MKELNGYLEHNGLIYKIQSIEQLRDFMNGLGERAKEMTEQELASLCVNPNPGKYVDKEYSDSCGVRYYYDGTKLIQGRADLKEYKIADGTVAVCNYAFNLNGTMHNRKDILSKYACGYRKMGFSNACVREIKWSPNLKYIGDSAFVVVLFLMQNKNCICHKC